MFTLPSGACDNIFSDYPQGPVEYTFVENGVSNSLTLDNGGTVNGLDGIPAGTDVTLSNGTTLNLGSQSIALGAVTLNDGSTISFVGQGQSVTLGAVTLNDGSTLDLGGQGQSITAGAVTLNDGWITDGSISAGSYALMNGQIDADLAGGPVAMTGDGVVELTGANSYTGGTAVSGTGILEAQTPASLPGYDSSGVVTIGSGATLAIAVGARAIGNRPTSTAFSATSSSAAGRRWASTPATATSSMRATSRIRQAVPWALLSLGTTY